MCERQWIDTVNYLSACLSAGPCPGLPARLSLCPSVRPAAPQRSHLLSTVHPYAKSSSSYLLTYLLNFAFRMLRSSAIPSQWHLRLVVGEAAGKLLLLLLVVLDACAIIVVSFHRAVTPSALLGYIVNAWRQQIALLDRFIALDDDVTGAPGANSRENNNCPIYPPSLPRYRWHISDNKNVPWIYNIALLSGSQSDLFTFYRAVRSSCNAL